ncbi:MAG TPA: transglutaminase-like cysteine peptidase [Methylovirgula sp.]|jgi:predicted transglutaminase-like cysteine proteinase|nr:transglutaminase-like cysteine peptidase [Methylovirgula sp.]
MRIHLESRGAVSPRSEAKLGFAVVFAAAVLCVPPAVASDTIGASPIHSLQTLNGAFSADIDGLHPMDAPVPFAISGSVADFTSFDFAAPDTQASAAAQSASAEASAVVESVKPVAKPAAAAVQPSDPNIFGTASISISHLAIDARWQEIAPLHPKSLFGASCDGDRALCNTPLMHTWQRIRSNLAAFGGSRVDLLRHVNTEVNTAVRYRSDTENYGVPDYWASPAEVARRGSGDCKEFALAKMWILAALDIPASSMRLVVVRDTRNGLGHAVLSVDVDGTNFILDNMSNQLRTDRMIGWYQPLYSLNTLGSWLHGVRHAPAVASQDNAQQLAQANLPSRSDSAATN